LHDRFKLNVNASDIVGKIKGKRLDESDGGSSWSFAASGCRSRAACPAQRAFEARSDPSTANGPEEVEAVFHGRRHIHDQLAQS